MKKLILVIYIFGLLTAVQAQQNFTNFLGYLNSIQDSVRKAAVIDSFITAKQVSGIPTVEGNYAIFLYRGNASSVVLAGDFSNWNASLAMQKVIKSNFFYFSKSFELNARLDYKIVVDGSYILDPLNTKTCPGGYGPNSELAMPGYVQPWEINFQLYANHGSVDNRTISSAIVPAQYDLQIYTPYGYSASPNLRYPVVYFQDGTDYTIIARAGVILDNIIDSNLTRPFIAVFVKPNNRNDEYAGALRNKYHQFFAQELVPYIDSLYRTNKSREQRLVLGDSFGGNISALITYYHSDIFANCGLHSGAFWPNSYEAYNLIVNDVYRPVKYFATWGTYEPLWENMRAFRDSLILKGNQFAWLELPEGHSWGQWRANIKNMITYFYPPIPAGLEETRSGEVKLNQLRQNFPNPVQKGNNLESETTIDFSLAKRGHTTLKVYDTLGKMVAELVNKELEQGVYKVKFNTSRLAPGVYIYQLSLPGFTEAKKMIVNN